MDQPYTSQRIRIYQDNIIHIKRQLQGGGIDFRVAVGQEVIPADILGEGHHATGFRTIHLAKELGVSPGQALNFLKRPVGKNIYQGELLALREGFLGFKKKVLLSPIDGLIDYYDDKSGDLKIKLLPKPVRLVSGVYGVVDDIDKLNGSVLVRTRATIIYGIFGTGKERAGLLKVLGSAGDLIGAKQISSTMMGNILVSGGLISLDALEKGVSIGVTGFISGGIGFEDYRAMGGSGGVGTSWADVGITLMVTEGFGLIPIGDDIFKVLQKHDGKFAILDGNSNKLILPSQDQNSMIFIRKASLPKTLYVKIDHDKGLTEVCVGAKVRIISVPFLGLQGSVEAIDKSPTKLPSGITTLLVTVTTKERKIKMPYQNLEVIG